MITVRIKQDDGKMRVIGKFCPVKKVLFVERKRSLHFMRKLQAWGLDAEVYSKLKKEGGLQKIFLKEKESGKEYVAEVQDFDSFGKFLHFKPYRAQVFLGEEHWREVG